MRIAKPSKTTNRLHFSDLDASRFEDLCLSILYPMNNWQDICHYGRSGSDSGVDILGIELLANGQPRTWYVQCRRYKQASIATLKKAIDDSIQATTEIPQIVLVVVACDVSRTAQDQFIEYATQKGIAEPKLWTQSILEAMLYSDRTDLLFTYFGISLAQRARTRESAIKRNIALKKRMRKDFIKPFNKEEYHSRPRRPYDKLAYSEIVIHSIDDEAYPNSDNRRTRMSSWVKKEVYDFYYNGLSVLVRVESGIIDGDGNWSIIENGWEFDKTKYKSVNIIKLGNIPFNNIVEYDLDGDDYYNCPHVYCVYANNGMPYEGFTYVISGEEYDPPLDPDSQFHYTGR
jgi:hypothetical protein